MNLSKSLLLLSTVAFAASAQSATQIAAWTFETNTPADLSNSATISGISADTGSGTVSGVHLSADTDWSTPAGNGSANSLSSNTWAIGDYYQFSIDGTGYATFDVSWDQTGSNTGPRDFTLFYSVAGSSLEDSNYDYTLVNGSWTSGSATLQPTSFSYSLVMPSNVTGSVVFRLVNASTTSINNGTVATAGTGRVDNFVVMGTAAAVPEPSTFATLFGTVGLAWAGLRRRNRGRA